MLVVILIYVMFRYCVALLADDRRNYERPLALVALILTLVYVAVNFFHPLPIR